MLAPRQHGPHVWQGHSLAGQPDQWTWRLDSSEIAELLDRSAPYRDSADHLPTISARQFGLPVLAGRLNDLRHRLLHGCGFELVKGWPARDVSVRQTAAAFLGIGAHLGSIRSQNAHGHLLGHVRDIGLDASDPDVRIYQTHERQTFHTDSCDVVGLLCLQPGATGGQSLLVSAATIYNEMLDRSPELASLLFEPVATDRRGEIPPGAEAYFTIPVLSWHKGFLTTMLQRQYINSAQRLPNAPGLSADVTAALDLFDKIANDPELHLCMKMETGDMLFVHNHSLLHDRTAFTSNPDAPRHLLRLWLSVKGDRELPACFAQRYGDITVGDRGGIVTSATTLHAPINMG